MYVKTNGKSQVLEHLLADARKEADEARRKTERLEKIIVSTRLIMGHELRKPAMAICGYLELAMEDMQGEAMLRARTFARKAADECELLNDLNDYFVDLLRVGDEDDEAGPQLINVRDVLAGVVARIDSELRGKREIIVEIEDEVGAVQLEPNALRLIVMNLVENSLKYSQVDSPVRVEASWGYDRRGGGEAELLKLRVIDDGVGVPREYTQRVFNPFVRLREDAADGSGLGLTLVKSLVELNEGEVSMQSGTGQGATVYVTLPARRREGSNVILL